MPSRGLKMCIIHPTRGGLQEGLVMMQKCRISQTAQEELWRFNLWHIKHYEFLHNQPVNLFEQHLDCSHVMFNIQWKKKPIQLSLSRKAAKLIPSFPNQTPCFILLPIISLLPKAPKVLYIVLNQSGQECLEMKTFLVTKPIKQKKTSPASSWETLSLVSLCSFLFLQCSFFPFNISVAFCL